MNRKEIGKNGKRHSGTREDTVSDNVNRLRALDGLCGKCTSIKAESNRIDGKNEVALRCMAGFSPLVLYKKTDFGKIPTCVGLSKE